MSGIITYSSSCLRKEDFVLFPIVRLKIRFRPLGVLGAICFGPSESLGPLGAVCPGNKMPCFPDGSGVLHVAAAEQEGSSMVWDRGQHLLSGDMAGQMALLFVSPLSVESVPFTKCFPHGTNSMMMAT